MYMKDIPTDQLRKLMRRGQQKDGDEYGQAAAKEFDARRLRAKTGQAVGRKPDDCCGETGCEDPGAEKKESRDERFWRLVHRA